MDVNVNQTSINLLSDMFAIALEEFENENKNDNTFKSKFESKWNELLKQMKNNEYYASSIFCVYYLLRLKNWTIGCGTKYGAHFLLYSQQSKNKNSSKRVHSRYLVLHNFDINNDLKLHCYVRLCKNVKKTLILTSFSDESMSEFNQTAILNQKWINNLRLTSVSCNLVQS